MKKEKNYARKVLIRNWDFSDGQLELFKHISPTGNAAGYTLKYPNGDKKRFKSAKAYSAFYHFIGVHTYYYLP